MLDLFKHQVKNHLQDIDAEASIKLNTITMYVPHECLHT